MISSQESQTSRLVSWHIFAEIRVIDLLRKCAVSGSDLKLRIPTSWSGRTLFSKGLTLSVRKQDERASASICGSPGPPPISPDLLPSSKSALASKFDQKSASKFEIGTRFENFDRISDSESARNRCDSIDFVSRPLRPSNQPAHRTQRGQRRRRRRRSAVRA